MDCGCDFACSQITGADIPVPRNVKCHSTTSVSYITGCLERSSCVYMTFVLLIYNLGFIMHLLCSFVLPSSLSTAIVSTANMYVICLPLDLSGTRYQ